VKLPYFNLELHGLDLGDPGDSKDGRDGFAPDLVAIQPELQVPLKIRRERLRSLLVGRGRALPIASILDEFKSRKSCGGAAETQIRR
jgi:hypothetical protein